MTELKPCPFCGSMAMAEDSDGMWIAYCSKCPASMGFFKTCKGLEKFWNRRASQ